MKKRLLVLLITFTFLFTLTVSSFAYEIEFTNKPCSNEDCGSNVLKVRTISGPPKSFSEPCEHHPYGTDITYYHYNYVKKYCYQCGILRYQKEVYIFDGIECHGSELAP